MKIIQMWTQLGKEPVHWSTPVWDLAVISHTRSDDGVYLVTAVLDSEDRLVRLEIGFLD